MRVLLALVLTTAAAWTQASEPDLAARREKAREILDRAAQMAGTAPPIVGVMAMMDIGAVYHVFDKEKAVYFLRHAFAAAATVEEDDRNFRTRFQGEIVKRLAQISASDAADMLRAMTEPGKDAGSGSATLKVVEVLLGKEKPEYDRAIEMVNLVPENADYAYDAGERIFLKLPKEDPRRTIVFGNALAAYKRHSAGTVFPQMLSHCWRQLPRDTAHSAVSTVVNAIENRAEDPGNNEAGFSANEEGVRRNNSRKAKELLDLIHVVRELDPKRAKELLAKYPEIADSPPPKEQEPKAGKDSSEPDEDATSFAMPLVPFHPSMNFEQMKAEMESYTKATKKADEARAAMAKDPKKALDLAAEVDTRMRASLLASLADTASGKDAALGQSLLEQCTGLLTGLKDPGDRVLPWAKISEAAHKLKNDKLTGEALQHALDDVVQVYARDTDPDMPNTALPDHWPAIVGCRMVMWSAVKSLGTAAEALLPGIHNQDLALLAQVEMGRALLDERRHEWSIQWNYTSK